MTVAAPRVELLSADFQNDPLPALAYYREHQPVFQAADMPVFVLTRFDDVIGMRDDTIYSTGMIRMLRESIDGLNMMQLDGEEHRRNRGLINVAFRAKVINDFADTEVVPLAEALLDDLAARPDGVVDLNPTFCEKLPLRSITRLLGLQIGEESTVADLYRDQIAYTPLTAGEDELRRSMAAREGLTTLLTPAIAHARASADASFLASVVAAESKDGTRLSEEELLGFLRFLLPAGLETTMSSLSNALFQIISRPDLTRRLTAHPELINVAIEETLRWHAPISYVNRLTLREVTVAGVTIPAQSIVLGSLNSANRDASVFPDPEVFDAERSPNKHIAFGVGAHACIGAPLARATLRIAIPRLLQRFPDVSVADGFTPHYAGVFDNRIEQLPVRLRG